MIFINVYDATSRDVIFIHVVVVVVVIRITRAILYLHNISDTRGTMFFIRISTRCLFDLIFFFRPKSR